MAKDDLFMNKYLYNYLSLNKHTKLTNETKNWELNNIDGVGTKLNLTFV